MGFKLKFFRHKAAKKEKKKEDIIADSRNKLLEIKGIPKSEASPHFLSLVKSFFSIFFKIKYQFDYTELDIEIQKKKLKKEIKEFVDNFLSRLQDFEYSAEAKPGEIDVLIKDFELLLAQLEVKEEAPVEKKPVLQIFDLKARLAKKVVLLIKEAEKSIEEGNFVAAKKLYYDISKKFNGLDTETKRHNYGKILKLHSQLASYYEMQRPITAISIKPEEILQIARERAKITEKPQIRLPIRNIFSLFVSTSLSALVFISQKLAVLVNFFGSIPAKYKNYAEKKNLEAVKNLLEQAKFLIENKELKNLKRLYSKISANFKNLGIEEKKSYYNKILWLHRQIRLLTKPEIKPEIKIISELPIKKPALLPKPRISLKPIMSLFAVVISFFKLMNSALIKSINIVLAAIEKIISFILQTIKLITSLPEKYKTYSERRKLEILSEFVSEARTAVFEEDVNSARRLYKKIDSFFSKLSKKERHEVYSKLIELHQEIALLSAKASTQKRLAKIDSLLAEAESCINKVDVKRARRSYEEISKFFYELPIEEKRISYGKIIRIYDRIARF